MGRSYITHITKKNIKRTYVSVVNRIVLSASSEIIQKNPCPLYHITVAKAYNSNGSVLLQYFYISKS